MAVFESQNTAASSQRFSRLGWNADETTFYYISALKKGIVGVDGALYLNPGQLSTKRSNAKVHTDMKHLCDDQGLLTGLGKAWALANLHFLEELPVAKPKPEEEGRGVDAASEVASPDAAGSDHGRPAGGAGSAAAAASADKADGAASADGAAAADGVVHVDVRAVTALDAAPAATGAAGSPGPPAGAGSAAAAAGAAAADGTAPADGSLDDQVEDQMGMEGEEASADSLNSTHDIAELKAKLQAAELYTSELVEANKALTAELLAAKARVSELSLENAEALETIQSYTNSNRAARHASNPKRAREDDSEAAANTPAASSNSKCDRTRADAATSGGFSFGAAAAPAPAHAPFGLLTEFQINIRHASGLNFPIAIKADSLVQDLEECIVLVLASIDKEISELAASRGMKLVYKGVELIHKFNSLDCYISRAVLDDIVVDLFVLKGKVILTS